MAGNRRSASVVLGLLLVAFVVVGAVLLTEWRQGEEEAASERIFEHAGIAADQAEAILGGASPTLAATVADAIEDGEPDLSNHLGIPGGGLGARSERGGARVDRRREPRPRLRGADCRPRLRRRLRPARGRRGPRAPHRPAARQGPAAVVATVPASSVADFVAPAVRHVPATSPAQAAVVAPDGRALVSTGLDRSLATSLAAAGRRAPSGELELGETTHLYSAAPIADSTWTVVLAAPRDDVLATAGGPAGWLGWGLLAELALAGLLGVLLLARLQRDAERVDRANVALSERSVTAEHATEAKSGFISTLAHEMRTPLAAISMFAEMMQTDELEPLAPTQRRRAADIAASTRHVLDLLDETLDISRIESGRLELRPERVSIAALAIEVVDGLYPLALERGIELSLEADGKLGETFVDPGRVRQLMTNFLSNALKFTPSRGRVRLRVERHGGHVRDRRRRHRYRHRGERGRRLHDRPPAGSARCTRGTRRAASASP